MVKCICNSNSKIDCDIFPLVNVLNSFPTVITIGSCQGHVFRKAGWYTPYVYFNASAEVAACMERTLRAYATDYQLHRYWSIEPMFNQRYEICYRLSCNSYETSGISAKALLFSDIFFMRKVINSEIAKLCSLFKDSSLLTEDRKPFHIDQERQIIHNDISAEYLFTWFLTLSKDYFPQLNKIDRIVLNQLIHDGYRFANIISFNEVIRLIEFLIGGDEFDDAIEKLTFIASDKYTLMYQDVKQDNRDL